MQVWTRLVLPAASDCEITPPTHATPNCFTDGAGTHGNNERCSMRVLTDVLLNASQYDVEPYYDYLAFWTPGSTSSVSYRGGSSK